MTEDQLERLQCMADDVHHQTWDLNDRDISAIKAAIEVFEATRTHFEANWRTVDELMDSAARVRRALGMEELS